MMTSTTPPAELIEVSARIGGDIDLVQGAGGNSSVKVGEVLWVKASGTWLAAAREQPIFLPLDLGVIHRGVAAGADDPIAPALLGGAPAGSLRPSIETSLHALLPHRLVLHVHSVNLIAWAVRADGYAELDRRLAGLNWAWVPYVRPGLPLTRALAAILRDERPDVLVLQNHGLVVGADDAAAAATLLAEVERRVAVTPRPTPPVDPTWLRRRRPPGYRLPRDETCHAIATDPESLRMAAGGSLYPDHVVFLGAHATLIDADGAADYRGAGDGPPWLLVRGSGVLLHETLPAGGEEMVRCLARVLPRIDPAARLVYLSPAQVSELLDWDAEKYRRQLAVGG